MLGGNKNVDLFGSNVKTFIGNKETNQQPS